MALRRVWSRSELGMSAWLAVLASATLSAQEPRQSSPNPSKPSIGGPSTAGTEPSAQDPSNSSTPVEKNTPVVENQPRAAPPAWTADARWYYVSIPRFCNGDSKNDPAEVIPWSTDWPTVSNDSEVKPTAQSPPETEVNNRRYGGDLQGLIKRLPYLKDLGVNALCLSPVFHGAGELRLGQVDLRHVDPWIGVKGSLKESVDETAAPPTWQWTSSDKLLLDLIRLAHEQGFRVVISGVFHAVESTNAPLAEFEAYYLAATRRWMDPDGNHNPTDGVDGWFLSFEEGPLRVFDAKKSAFWGRWREEVRRINPNAVVIGSGPLALARIAEGPFEIAFNESLAGAIQYFFSRDDKPHTAKELIDPIENTIAPGPQETRTGHLTPVSCAGQTPRLLSALAAGGRSPGQGRNGLAGPMPDDEARARWRLATVFQHFCPGAPVTYFGDEVGVYGGWGGFANAPMWWRDDSGAGATSSVYRDDFASIVQWLHRMRERYEPLRRGNFRRVLSDEAKKILAVSRSLPGDEVILVMNYGDKKQLVMLPAGKPGQLVAVFSPQIQPAERRPPRKPKSGAAKDRQDAQYEKIESLGVGGSRQFVNVEGKIRIWVAPMSVRVVFVNDKEPRH